MLLKQLLLLQKLLLLPLTLMLASTTLRSLLRKQKKAKKPRKQKKPLKLLLQKLLPQLLLSLLDTKSFESNSWKGPAGNGGPFLFVLIPTHR